jgi:hypothetical protein
MSVCCLLFLIILIVVMVLLVKEDASPNVASTFPPRNSTAEVESGTDDDFFYNDELIVAPGTRTSEMAGYDYDCDYENQNGYPSVWDQCSCDEEITVVPDDVAGLREELIEKLLPIFYGNVTYTTPISSCDPVNMALIWLASGDNRDAGYIRQRFVLALTFFAMQGPEWDYRNEWLSPLHECLWLGCQCNNWDVINSFAIDTNNVFGKVRILPSCVFLELNACFS